MADRTAPPSPRLVAVRAQRVFELLPPMLHAVLALLALLALQASFSLQGPRRIIEVGLDLAGWSAAATLRLLIARGRLRAEHANAAAALLLCLIATDTVVSHAIDADHNLMGYAILEIFGVGAVLLSRRWLAVTFAWLLAGATLALVLHPVRDLVDTVLALVVATALGFAVFVARMAATERLTEALEHEETRRRELEVALLETRRELEERHRVEAEREELRERLLHARKMEAIGTLAGGVAHDMNNVLMAIGTMAEALEEELPPGIHREDAQQILVAARRGAEFTKNLLGFSRKGKYRAEVLRVASLVNDLESLLSRSLPKQVRVRVAIDDDALLVEGDPSQLKHALLNVGVNASEAMAGAGEIVLGVRAVVLDGAAAQAAQVAPGRYVELSVRDGGRGMSEEVKRRAFEPFFTTKPEGGGSGLGLAMVYGAMQRHGGGVRVESEEGKGTSVLMLIPAVERKSEQPPKSTPRPREGKGVVLVVDDEELVRRGTGRLLKMLGYTAIFAENGAEALDIVRARSNEIDIVLLDLIMPVMGGAECFRAMHEIAPRLPVLLCSGYAKDRTTEDLLESGARAFLEKPYTKASLEAALGAVADRRIDRAAATPTHS